MDRIISSFLEHLIVEKGFSRNTSDAYRNDLGQFWDFLQDHSSHNLGGVETGPTNQNISKIELPNKNGIWTTVDIDVLNKYIEDLRTPEGLSRHHYSPENRFH